VAWAITAACTHHGNIIEAPWLVNGGHGASFRRHDDAGPTTITTLGPMAHQERKRERERERERESMRISEVDVYLLRVISIRIGISKLIGKSQSIQSSDHDNYDAEMVVGLTFRPRD
jgi:hypothetical protein